MRQKESRRENNTCDIIEPFISDIIEVVDNMMTVCSCPDFCLNRIAYKHM